VATPDVTPGASERCVSMRHDWTSSGQRPSNNWRPWTPTSTFWNQISHMETS
jgi:hypothetical protein